MSRPVDWEPLSGSDPVPGDVYEVTQLSGQLKRIAQTISEQADKLKRLTTADYWDSEASRTFDSTSQKVAGDLDKVYRRYEAAYEAVNGYIAPLENEQAATLNLLGRAQELETARREAQARLDADAGQNWTKPDGSRIPYPARHHDDRHTVDSYGAQLQALQKQMNDSVDRIRQAAQDAASRVTDAADHDGLKDSFWDKFEHVMSEIGDAVIKDLKQLSAVLEKISSVVGILAVILCWVPGLGELLAGLTLALAAISLAVDAVLAATGNGSWGKVLMDGVMVLAGGVAKGFQGGFKAMLAGGKLARAAEDVLPAITARGGQVSEDLVTALRTGNMSGATRLSQLGRGELGRLFGAQLGRLTRVQGVLGGGRNALLEAASKGSFKIADFNPFTNLREDLTSLPENLNLGRQLSALGKFTHGQPWGALDNIAASPSAFSKGLLSLGAQSGLAYHDYEAAWGGK